MVVVVHISVVEAVESIESSAGGETRLVTEPKRPPVKDLLMFSYDISPVRTDVTVRKFLEIVYDAHVCNSLVTSVTLSKPHSSVTVRKTHICVTQI